MTVVHQVLLDPLLGQVVPGDGGPLCLTQQDDPVSTDQVLPVQLGRDDGGDWVQVEVYLHAGREGSGVQGKVGHLTDHSLAEETPGDVEEDGAGDRVRVVASVTGERRVSKVPVERVLGRTLTTAHTPEADGEVGDPDPGPGEEQVEGGGGER